MPPRRTSLVLFLAGLCAIGGAAHAGTWTPLVRSAPATAQMLLLLSDGTVMVQRYNSTTWYRLTPDNHGSYINGTWTTLAPMHDSRLYYSSAVLRDGRVFIAGGEYGTGGAKSEVYDPLTNTWTTATIPTSLLDPSQTSPVTGLTQGFLDSDCKILANGNVLVTPVCPKTSGGTLIYNPTANTWAAGPTLFRGQYQDEASWVKLPDDSILTVDPFGTNSERYIPSLNAWINDSVLPVSLYDSVTFELGAALLLPDGRAFFLGATSHTALYTPTGTTSPGTWAAGADIPNGLATPDAPAAVLTNGKILCAVSQKTFKDANNNPVFPSPTSFYEYDPVANAFSQVNGPTGSTDNIAAFQAIMLDLPDGNVLYSHDTSQLYVYQPGGSPLAAGKPTILSITANANGSYHLTGTGFNGLCEGAAYGDDAQMDSNYPIVRATDASANVYYGRTFNWSSTGVRTRTALVSTDFTLPASVPGAYSLVVVANGIASDPFNPQPADFDRDGDVDQSDFGQFQNCLTGQNVAQTKTQCQPARLDADGDVDADDLTLFVACLSGADVPANPHCIN